VPDIAPGKEERFRRLQRSLAVSDWVDRVIEATEPSGDAASQRPRGNPAPRPRGLRAGLAARLARLALTLDRRAAGDAFSR
jgi:hypothetical protein